MKSPIGKPLSSVRSIFCWFLLTSNFVFGVENFESLKIVETVLPGYPMKVAYEGIYEGSARVIIKVIETGEVEEVYLESYTHPEFGRLADKFIKKWTFQPAKLNGEPITSIKPIEINFDDKRGVFSVGIEGSFSSITNFTNHVKSKRVYDHSELDRGADPIELARPLFPEDFKNTNTGGSASVIFYIDETGATRMPYLDDYSHVSFGNAALFAVEQWKFSPPIVHGKPVAIVARQKFNFSGKNN